MAFRIVKVVVTHEAVDRVFDCCRFRERNRVRIGVGVEHQFERSRITRNGVAFGNGFNQQGTQNGCSMLVNVADAVAHSVAKRSILEGVGNSSASVFGRGKCLETVDVVKNSFTHAKSAIVQKLDKSFYFQAAAGGYLAHFVGRTLGKNFPDFALGLRHRRGLGRVGHLGLFDDHCR